MPLNSRLSTAALVDALQKVLGLEDGDFFDAPSVDTEGNVTFVRESLNACQFAVGCLAWFLPDSTLGKASIERWYALGGAGYGAAGVGKRELDREYAHTYVQITQAWCRIAVNDPNNSSVRGQATLSDALPGGQAAIRAGITSFSLAALGEVPTPGQLDDLEDLFAVYQPESTVAAWTAVCAAILRDPLFMTY